MLKSKQILDLVESGLKLVAVRSLLCQRPKYYIFTPFCNLFSKISKKQSLFQSLHFAKLQGENAQSLELLSVGNCASNRTHDLCYQSSEKQGTRLRPYCGAFSLFYLSILLMPPKAYHFLHSFYALFCGKSVPKNMSQIVGTVAKKCRALSLSSIRENFLFSLLGQLQ